MTKPSLLVLIYGEYRTFEECLPTYSFLFNNESYDTDIACSFWDKTITHDHRANKSEELMTETLVPVHESNITTAFRANGFKQPEKIVLHKYFSHLDYGKGPLPWAWKRAFDVAHSLPKKYDYVFLVRPDMMFKIKLTLPESDVFENKTLLTHLFDSTQLNEPYDSKYLTEMQDYYFMGQFNDVETYVTSIFDNWDFILTIPNWHEGIKTLFDRLVLKQVHFPEMCIIPNDGADPDNTDYSYGYFGYRDVFIKRPEYISPKKDKKKVLVLYNGEFRSFKESVKSHDFLLDPKYEMTIAISTWNQSTIENPDVNVALQRDKEEVYITEDDVREALLVNDITLPHHIWLHDKGVMKELQQAWSCKRGSDGEMHQMPPIMVSWKMAIDCVKNLLESKSFDYIFMLRPDLYFDQDAFLLCDRRLKNFDNRKLIGAFTVITRDPEIKKTRRSPREKELLKHAGLPDVYFFGNTKTIIDYMDEIHKFFVDESYWPCPDHWHGWLLHATNSLQYKITTYPNGKSDGFGWPVINRMPASMNETYGDVVQKFFMWRNGKVIPGAREKRITNHLFAFDLDGTLVDTMDIHFDALNSAIQEVCGEEFTIKSEERSVYEGIPTKVKLDILGLNKFLPMDRFPEITAKKQEYTAKLIQEQIQVDENLIQFFEKLRSDGNKIVIVTNCIRSTTLLMLKQVGLLDLIDDYVCNEDGFESKPAPDMYNHIIEKLEFKHNRTVIFEDSPAGYMAAINTDAHVIRVTSPKDINLETMYPLLLQNLPASEVFREHVGMSE